MFKLPLAQLSLEQWEQLLEAQGLLPLAAEPDRGVAGAPAAPAAQQQRRQQGAADPPSSLPELQQRLADLPVCLCLGAEGQGLSAGVAAHCRPVSIPQAGGGAVMESLNVAAAGAILMAALSPGAVPLLAELASL